MEALLLYISYNYTPLITAFRPST